MNATDDFRPYDNNRNDDSNREGRTSSQRNAFNNDSSRYQQRPVYSANGGDVKRKRPRVGDVRMPVRKTYNQGGGYNNDQRGGYERRSSGYGNNNYNSYGDRDSGGYNNGYNNRSAEERPYRNNNRYNNDNRYDGGVRQATPNRKATPSAPESGFNRRPNVATGGKVAKKKKNPVLIKPIKYQENIDPNTPIRLNKYLANAGVCSRREADDFIIAGIVKVNGVVVSELGSKVTRGDLITFHDEPIKLESKVYVLLNKPKNTITTSDDPKNRRTVMDIVKSACPERIFPVGRLDRNTTGVLLLTNDGDLASKLMHPKYKKKKIYQVKLDRDVEPEHMQAIADGIELEDGEIHADSIAYVAEGVYNEVGIEIHSGRNRLVRRIFDKLGYQVMKLDRVYFAGLTKKNLGRGKWRYLNEKEVNMLRMGAFE